MPIAYGSLRHLRDERLRIPEQKVLNRAAPGELSHHLRRREAVRDPGALHDCATGRRFTTHEKRDAQHTFIADHGDLGGRAILQNVKERNDAVHREVDVLKEPPRFIQDLAQRQVHELELSAYALQLDCRKRSQEAVLSRIDGRHGSPRQARSPILHLRRWNAVSRSYTLPEVAYGDHKSSSA